MKLPFDADLDPRTVPLPNLVDHYVKIKPDAIYAEYPINPTSYDQGYRKITYKAFGNAINGLAQFLVDSLGQGNGEVLAYVGPNDLRYPGLVLGAQKAGYCMFLTSPRNSVEAHRSLLQNLDCNMLLTPVPPPPFIGAIKEAHPVKTLDIPSLETLLTTEYPHFEYSKSLSESINEKAMIVHTSGSTGIPKPIIWKHDSFWRNMNMQFLQPPAGCEAQEEKFFGKRLYMTLPPFHAAGIAYMLPINIPGNITIIVPTSGGLPTLNSLMSAREKTSFDLALVSPNIIGEIAQDPKALDYLSTHLEHIMYVGGDVPDLMGNTVAKKLPLMNGYGASETGLLNVIHASSRDPYTDWRYLHFHPQLGVEMQHVSGDEYEVVIVRHESRVSNQLPFIYFPHLEEYHTKDLMIPHPTKPDFWRPSARLDDVIVFLNGEKTNPVSFEHHIVAVNPEVRGCLVVGAQRFQAALVVELASESLSVNDRAAMIEKLWPSIEEANSVCPAHARITKSHILFAPPEKPMLRSGKGTVQRAMTVKLYEQEIENLYSDADKMAALDAAQVSGPGLDALDDTAKVAEYVKATIQSATGWPAENLTDEADWFLLGLDSLQTITATRVLRHGLNLPTLSPNLIYLNPSVTALTHALQNFHKTSKESAEVVKQKSLQQRDGLLQELSGRIEIPETQRNSANPTAHTVILTGSTGQLGTYLLDCLLKSSQVQHVYCLNRDEAAHDRCTQRGASYGLASFDESRVTFWKADLSQKDLGLQSDQLEKLHQTATLIIHNAWTVDFNLSLASFKPQLEGVVNLINFSGQASASPRMLFISSISSVLGNQTDTGLTPESLITTTSPAPNGYATSKYIAEHLLGYASQRGLSASVARVGQVAGSIYTPGLWNKSEWLPSVALSSVHIGALPNDLGASLNRVDWVPIDLLSEILVDLSLLNRSELNVYHLVNVNSKPWSEVQPAFSAALEKSSGKPLETIPLRNWVLRVRKDIESVIQDGKVLDEKNLHIRLTQNPAAKLLEFFETLVAQTESGDFLDTQKTADVSEKLRGVDAIKPEWIEKWVKEWLQ